MVKDVVIAHCNRTGILVRPWAEFGYECYCVDIDHSIRNDRVENVGAGKIHYVWGDARSWRLSVDPKRVAIGFGSPPCTHLAISGARDFLKKSGWLLADAVQIFDSIEVAFSYGGFPYMIENPKSRLTSHRRKHDHHFQPWWYGDLWFKDTWLWTGGGFRMPIPTHTRPPEGTTDKIFRMGPSEDRADLRSEDPPGFARAVFGANHSILSKAARSNHSTNTKG